MINLSGKIAIITGGAGGIGRAAALGLVRAGAKIVVVDLAEEPGKDTVREIEALGGSALFVKADVTKAEDVAAYVNAACEHFGRIDIFINNAAWEGVVTSLVDYPDDIFDKVVAINIRGVFLGLKHVLPVMYAQDGGVVINTSSVAGHIGTQGLVAYTASKHAVLGMTKTAAIEGAKFNVRVNAVSPGAVDTRMLRSIASLKPEETDEALQKFAAASPNGRLATPEEISNVMLFLASDLSKHMSGQSFRVDGGRIMY